MANYIAEVESLLEEDETILKEIIVQRIVKSVSTYIFLTNKRLVYWKCGFFRNGFKAINLSEIRTISYLPQVFSSAGLIKVITKKDKNLLLSPSFVGQLEANDFIDVVKKTLQ